MRETSMQWWTREESYWSTGPLVRQLPVTFVAREANATIVPLVEWKETTEGGRGIMGHN